MEYSTAQWRSEDAEGACAADQPVSIKQQPEAHRGQNFQLRATEEEEEVQPSLGLCGLSWGLVHGRCLLQCASGALKGKFPLRPVLEQCVFEKLDMQ